MLYGFTPSLVIPKTPVEGNFWITSTVNSLSFFHKKHKHTGYFLTKEQKIPCVYYQTKGKRLASNKLYWIKASLQQRHGKTFLKAAPDSFIPVKKHLSLEYLRRKAKDKISSLLKRSIRNTDSRDLLYTLFTSEQVNPYLSFTFSRLGLSHLLAISGFHFALLIGGLTWIFSSFFSEKKRRVATFLVATLYFIFLGPLPSVFRAWLLLFFYTLGYFLKKPTDFLNLLGASLFVELCFFPGYISHPGFQLSFLCCLALALGYKPIDSLWGNFFKKRSFKERKELSWAHRGIYYLGRYFRELLSLQIAVTFFTLPVVLFWFGSFPLYSFLYNLFVPLLLSGILGLLLISLSLFWLPYISSFLFSFLEAFTTFCLRCILHPPKTYEILIQAKELQLATIVLMITVIFVWFVKLKNKNTSFLLNNH